MKFKIVAVAAVLIIGLLLWFFLKPAKPEPNLKPQITAQVNDSLNKIKPAISAQVDAMSDSAVDAQYERKRAENK